MSNALPLIGKRSNCERNKMASGLMSTYIKNGVIICTDMQFM